MSGIESPLSAQPFNWDKLISRIEQKKVTPFLGAGASARILPTGSAVAKQWAAESRYPFPNDDDLVSVAQYLAITEDPAYPKERMINLLSKHKVPADEIHDALAALPLPVYITTNYDHLMVDALKRANRAPRQEYCRWHAGLREGRGRDSTDGHVDAPSIFDSRECRIDDCERPIVFHLHGHMSKLESLVISEDDYLEFLVEAKIEAGKDGIVPLSIQRRLVDSVLLFVGYRIADWNFRVLFHALQSQAHNKYEHISIQLEPTLQGDQLRSAQKYLMKHFDRKKIQVYWGDAGDFMRNLRQKWEESRSQSACAVK